MELKSKELFGEYVKDFNLFPYQYDGVRYMEYVEMLIRENDNFCKGCVFSDIMGFGKTRQVVALCEIRKVMLTLIICTASTKYSWFDEVFRTTSNIEIFCISDGKYKKFQYKNDKFIETDIKDYIIGFIRPAIVIITKDILTEKILTNLINSQNSYILNWDRICIDEAHMLKNGVDVGIYDLCNRINQRNEDGKIIGSKIAITGTPISNDINDLVSIFRWIDNRTFNNSMNKAQELSNLISTNLFRRNKDQLIPEIKIVMKYPSEEPKKYIIKVQLPETELSKYFESLSFEQMRDQLLSNFNIQNLIKTDERAFLIYLINNERYIEKNKKSLLTENMTVRNILSSPYSHSINNRKINFIGESSKISTIVNILKSKKDESFVIFYNFLDFENVFKNKIDKYFPNEYIISVINGETKTLARFEILKTNKELMKSGKKSILLASIQACSEGLNFQMYSNLIKCEQSWNTAIEKQCENRVYRIGQEKIVNIYELCLSSFCIGKEQNGDDINIKFDEIMESVKMSKDLLSDIIETNNAAFFFKRLYLPINGVLRSSSYFGDEFESRERGSFGPDSVGDRLLETYPLY